jgi:hypothetical protein
VLPYDDASAAITQPWRQALPETAVLRAKDRIAADDCCGEPLDIGGYVGFQRHRQM